MPARRLRWARLALLAVREVAMAETAGRRPSGPLLCARVASDPHRMAQQEQPSWPTLLRPMLHCRPLARARYCSRIAAIKEAPHSVVSVFLSLRAQAPSRRYKGLPLGLGRAQEVRQTEQVPALRQDLRVIRVKSPFGSSHNVRDRRERRRRQRSGLGRKP
ncbi:hypothetical protein BCAR13_110142 [Paraburkholderia caribensis]|nr:hypothetical protein BCAR13_110142 [Paraburkholderia caribensis]